MAQAKPPPTILDLEVEILSMIFAQVFDEAPQTAVALSLVNKYFNNAAKLVRYRHTTLQWVTTNECFVSPTGLLPSMLTTPEFLRGLRHLTIGMWDKTSYESGIKRDASLNELLRQVKNLQSLTWDDDVLVPASVLDTLEMQHPRAKLNVRRIRSFGQLDASDTGTPFAGRKCLASLGAEILGGPFVESHHIAFQHIISNSPNLKFASLISNGVSLPEVSGWETWHVKSNPNNSLRHLTLDGWPLSAETLDYWSQFVDMTALHSLKCSRGLVYPSYFTRATQVLTNLKHVSLNLTSLMPEVDRSVQEYIATCAPLSSLSIWSWVGRVRLSTILSKHGDTLTELHLHEREASGVDRAQQALRPGSLEKIVKSCPRLTALTFDLSRQTQFLDVEDYEAHLGWFDQAKLDSVQIYFDCGLSYAEAFLQVEGEFEDGSATELALAWWFSEDFRMRCGGDLDSGVLSPIFFNLETACYYLSIPQDATSDEFVPYHPPSSTNDICQFVGELWRRIFGSRTTGKRQLKVKFGEWERRTDHATEDLRVFCQATPLERDDMIGECRVLVQCCQGEYSREFETA